MILGAGVLIYLGEWRQVWPAHHNSDWRGAAAAINALPGAERLPVLCPSPFVEARSPAWSPDYKLPGFLYAHLAAYLVKGRLVLFPFQTLNENWTAHVELGEQFVIYGQAPSVAFWRDWYLAQPQYKGRTWRKLGDFGDVSSLAVSSAFPQ